MSCSRDGKSESSCRGTALGKRVLGSSLVVPELPMTGESVLDLRERMISTSSGMVGTNAVGVDEHVQQSGTKSTNVCQLQPMRARHAMAGL